MQMRHLIVALSVWCLLSAMTSADTLDRIAPERLQAVHEAIAALKTQRREVQLVSGFEDVRTLLHVHSAFSHDSRGTIDEIIAAAREVGVRVIMFSEHPASHYDYFVDGHRGIRDGVLLIPGAETGGFLAYPRQSVQNQKTDSPQAFASLVRATGGEIFLCHLEERMDWDIAHVTGTEIYNTHADFKDEVRFAAALNSPLTLFSLSSSIRQFPQEVFGALLDYPADYLRRYDELCQQARHTGVAGNDSHHNQAYRARIDANGSVLLEDGVGEPVTKLDAEKIVPLKLLTAGKQAGDVIFELDLDPYERSFRHVSTHLLLREVNETQVRQALADGRAYVAFDWIADPTGFVYLADTNSGRQPMGSEVAWEEGLKLRVESPLSARIKLVRNGAVVHDERSSSLEYLVGEPGNYRVELWLELGGEERPWILTNPIYVRGEQLK